VVNNHANTITVYAAGASGNTAPVATIGGASTGLDGPCALALDASGRIYVANRGSHAILVFAPGSNGNVAPATTIAGAHTGLNDPVGIALL
jgi:hypothetical protein